MEENRMTLYKSSHCSMMSDSMAAHRRCLLLSVLTLVALTSPAQPESLPLGLPDSQVSSASPPLIALGRQLFFDVRLSRTESVSCGTCHQPSQVFTDGRAVAQGAGDRAGTRNTPSLLNTRYLTTFFWDGRRSSLEEQAGDPFINPLEHGLASHEELQNRLRETPTYGDAFRTAFPRKETLSIDLVTQAIAAYVRTLVSGNSPFDRYLYGGEIQALSPQAARGLILFRGAAECSTCHHIGERDALLTDGQFHRVGVGAQNVQPRLAELVSTVLTRPGPIDHRIMNDAEFSQLGRFLLTRNPKDIGKFRTPSLRNVAMTAPYMHDGSIATLEEAVDRELYYRGAQHKRPVLLSPTDRAALVEFLKSLTSPALPQ